MIGFVSKIAKKLHVPTVQEREMAYLGESRDRYDLEYRQHQIDRGMFRNNGRNDWL